MRSALPFQPAPATALATQTGSSEVTGRGTAARRGQGLAGSQPGTAKVHGGCSLSATGYHARPLRSQPDPAAGPAASAASTTAPGIALDPAAGGRGADVQLLHGHRRTRDPRQRPCPGYREEQPPPVGPSVTTGYNPFLAPHGAIGVAGLDRSSPGTSGFRLCAAASGLMPKKGKWRSAWQLCTPTSIMLVMPIFCRARLSRGIPVSV